ncbi:gamma-glutamyl-gamma-aminobutyrate hydrolase family protein [Rhodoferax sp. GW822-FHT02A01]|uniref:gamma-glutamyl-gamma-aminobutyrate hydrolase family protein n=1 Tax=Rhodoferax sp. GW822-FHT02A01 TaxID=3141537 RepID=UPI00315C5BC7
MKKPLPLVWLPADHRLLGNDQRTMPFLVLGDKYARAVKCNADAQPVLFPLADADQIDALLALVDGVMLTGSPSNVHPQHFGKTLSDPSLMLDEQRDSLTLALVRACVAQAVPLLGICRGFQEINVALGGTLHQKVHELPSHMDHRESPDDSYELQYAPSHEVRLEAGSTFARWAGSDVAQVNSVHGQGIDRLAQGLRALGRAPDGLVEAFEVQGAPAFAYAVQWHPEWKTSDNPFYAAIFKAFGEACRARQVQRLGA